MSNAARKARKRAGVKLIKPAKVGTPLLERSFFVNLVPGAPRTRYAGTWQRRSLTKRNRVLKAYDLKPVKS